MRISSTVSHYRVRLPNNFFANQFDCPIVYLLRKYGLNNSLPIPVPKRIDNREYIVALPENITTQFCNILETEEDCVCTFIQTRDYAIENFEDTFVGENFITVDGVNRVDYFLTMRVHLA
jgi:hypothetical protein